MKPRITVVTLGVQDLGYTTELTYRILTDKVQPWDYGNAKNRYLNVAPDLKESMTENRGSSARCSSMIRNEPSLLPSLT